MVRFGADEIFASKSKQLTDEDIDVLLKRGEERTAEQNKKIETDAQHNLANFSLTTQDAAPGSLFEFEGANYRGAKGAGLLINLPTRERKRNYDVDEYFRDTLNDGSKKRKEPREKKRKARIAASRRSFVDFEAIRTASGSVSGATGGVPRTASPRTGRRCDVAAGRPSTRRRRRRASGRLSGPRIGAAAAWRRGPRAPRCCPRGRAGASRGRRARASARGRLHTHCLTQTASPRSRRCRDAVAATTRASFATVSIPAGPRDA